MKGLVLLLIAVLSVAALTLGFGLGTASGSDPHGACGDGVVSIVGSADLVTYDASPNLVDGVCVKAGNIQLHTLYTADFTNACYAVTGIGTSVVTVTRLGEGRECQGISHIDVTTSAPTPTPTPTPSATPTPTPSPTPTTTPTPTPTAGTSTSETPLSLPSTGGEPSESGGAGLVETLTWVGFALAGAGLAMSAVWFLIKRRN